jgi:hypothetical protein
MAFFKPCEGQNKQKRRHRTRGSPFGANGGHSTPLRLRKEKKRGEIGRPQAFDWIRLAAAVFFAGL